MNRRIAGALLATLFAVAIGPANAGAAEFCVVPAANCSIDDDPNAFPTLGAAVDASNSNGNTETDTIRLGAASYTPETETEEYSLMTKVDIVGAGRGKTIINSGPKGFFTLALFVGGSHVSDLTIRMGEAGLTGETEYGLALLGSGTTAERIEVIANDDVVGGIEEAAVLLQGGPVTFKDSTVRAPTGPGRETWGIEALSNPAGTIVENVSVVADKGIVGYGQSTLSVKNVDITANRGISQYTNNSSNFTVDTGVVRGIPGMTTDPTGIHWTMAGGSVSPLLTVRNLTLVGNGAGIGTNVEVTNCAGPPTGSPKVVMHNSLTTGFAVAGRTKGCNTACPGAASAVLENHYSAFNTLITNIDGGCAPTDNAVFPASMGLVSDADPRPRFGSPAIDAGDPAAATPDDPALDQAGLGRFVDGNADGTARRDIGAFEYQRRAPTVTASVNPGSGTPGTSFAFSASASDPDGDPITSFAWAFSDGGSGSGAAVSHAFSPLGSNTGTVTVKDAAGLSASSSASVTVVPAPTPSPSPTPTVVPPPKDTTGPNVTVKGGTLRSNKRRRVSVTITCPASEPAPCKIALTAASAKKIRLGKGRAKVQSLGKGSGSVPPGKSAKVTLTLSKKAYSYIKRKKKLAARLAVTASDAAGNSTKSSAKATLRPPR